jgi:hypothetical protein
MADEKFDVKVEIVINDVSAGEAVLYSRITGESFGCGRVAMHGIETAVAQALLGLGDEAIKLRAAEGGGKK